MKKTFSAVSVLAAVALFTPPALPAPDKPVAAKPAVKEAPSQPAQRAARPKSDRRAATSANVIAEVLGKGFSVGAKQTRSFDSASDFSGATSVSIAVEAPGSMDIGNENFRMIVWWSMPELDWFTSQDVVSGKEFYFSNQGGAVIPVYGSELRIEIRNDSENDLTINQLTVYAVSR